MFDLYLGDYVKVVSVNEEWIDDKEKFVLEWMTHFIKEKNKGIDVAFIMFIDQLGYNWLRSLSFVKELPTGLIKDTMPMRLDRDNGNIVAFDLNKVEDDLHESPKETYLKLGKELAVFFK
jgi:hypothetical protein